MKAMIYILLAFFGIHSGVLYAGTHKTGDRHPDLFPVTPREATFEEAFLIPGDLLDLMSLRPTLPAKADFSDEIPARGCDTEQLVPEVPAEADFEEIVFNDNRPDYSDLAPVLPATADFKDNL